MNNLFKIIADGDDMHLVMGEQIKPGTDLHEFNIVINDSIYAYKIIGYTTYLIL